MRTFVLCFTLALPLGCKARDESSSSAVADSVDDSSAPADESHLRSTHRTTELSLSVLASIANDISSENQKYAKDEFPIPRLFHDAESIAFEKGLRELKTAKESLKAAYKTFQDSAKLNQDGSSYLKVRDEVRASVTRLTRLFENLSNQINLLAIDYATPSARVQRALDDHARAARVFENPPPARP